MFQKGHEKIGGRQKGTQNKTSTEIRKNATIMLQSELDVLKEKLPKLNDSDYIKAIALLFKHVLPSQKQIEVDTIDHPVNFQVEIIDRLSQVTEKECEAAIDDWVQDKRNK